MYSLNLAYEEERIPQPIGTVVRIVQPSHAWYAGEIGEVVEHKAEPYPKPTPNMDGYCPDLPWGTPFKVHIPKLAIDLWWLWDFQVEEVDSFLLPPQKRTAWEQHRRDYEALRRLRLSQGFKYGYKGKKAPPKEEPIMVQADQEELQWG